MMVRGILTELKKGLITLLFPRCMPRWVKPRGALKHPTPVGKHLYSKVLTVQQPQNAWWVFALPKMLEQHNNHKL